MSLPYLEVSIIISTWFLARSLCLFNPPHLTLRDDINFLKSETQALDQLIAESQDQNIREELVARRLKLHFRSREAIRAYSRELEYRARRAAARRRASDPEGARELLRMADGLCADVEQFEREFWASRELEEGVRAVVEEGR